MILRKRGDTYPHKVEIRRYSTKQLVDLSGSIITWSVSESRSPSTDSYLFQIVGNITGNLGEVEFPMTTTEADNVGVFQYDIQIFSAGEVRTIDRGTITFEQDITK